MVQELLLSKRCVTVIGSSKIGLEGTEAGIAEKLGALLASGGFIVVTAGYQMEAVNRGAALAGGKTIGILAPVNDERKRVANPWLTDVIYTNDYFERLKMLLVSATIIALPGGIGTLAELFVAWNLCQIKFKFDKRCIILLGKLWSALIDVLVHFYHSLPHYKACVRIVETPEDAVAICIEQSKDVK